ncbi:hypothetical protein [Hoeflea alexandrii]|uniref:Uncharacterized protein n=1 Tax=Hoeflea alexandrii TaxID=288436 RepID=A0ABT1CP33_9HYPH|nr:hypothetical protein [Hoeflea alexandrii]MCO6407345.1 hypothetical protein [Hoeflea alexandrii]MCY0154258.1 hypothetical protein [Hoeflea alexandrii]
MITRRTVLKAVPFAGLAVSTGALASPDERIESALETIRAALAEKYPDFQVLVGGGIQTIENADTGALDMPVVHRLEIIGFAHGFNPPRMA